MNTVQSVTDATQKNNSQTGSGSISSTAAGSTSGYKEHEPKVAANQEAVREISQEIQLPKELQEIGVEQISGTIELPPDVKKLGVTPSAPVHSASQTGALPAVTLPISDQKILAGLHASITSAIRWLATWCIKRLKRAHVLLRAVGGKAVRTKA